MFKSKAVLTLWVAAALALMSSAWAVEYNDSPADRDAWFDITVLSAKVLPRVTFRDFVDLEKCAKVDERLIQQGGEHRLEWFDCTDHVSTQLNATIIKPLRLVKREDGELAKGDAYILDSPFVEIQTVIPEGRTLRLSSHIGFSEAFMGGSVNLFPFVNAKRSPKSEVRLDGKTVTLKDGRRGLVHRWYALYDSNAPTGRPEVPRTVAFKPVLVRDAEKPLRYWDRLIGEGIGKNYVITNHRYDENKHTTVFFPSTSYDRAAELLK